MIIQYSVELCDTGSTVFYSSVRRTQVADAMKRGTCDTTGHCTRLQALALEVHVN